VEQLVELGAGERAQGRRRRADEAAAIERSAEANNPQAAGELRSMATAGGIDLALEQGASHGAARMPFRHHGTEASGRLFGRVIHRPFTAFCRICG